MVKFLHKIAAWYNYRKKEAILFCLIFLVSSLSFGIGYLFATDSSKAPIVIEKCSESL